MIYGYARVSTPKQSIDRQVRNILKDYPTAVIIRDEYTGTKLERPGWTRLYRKLKQGDTVIFDSVNRMSRSAEDGYNLYQSLYTQGVSLIFLKEPHINTDTYKKALTNGVALTGTKTDIILKAVNEYLMELAKEQIKIAFDQSEKEVADLHQRTREGIETARLKGKQIGQRPGAKLTTKKSIAAKDVIRKHARAFHGTLSDIECMKLAGVSRNTYYKYKRELANESE